jgi:hypothetical protein
MKSKVENNWNTISFDIGAWPFEVAVEMLLGCDCGMFQE